MSKTDEYISNFPNLRYSSGNLLSDQDHKDISNLLGGSDASKLFSLKMEDILYKSQKENEAGKTYAGINTGDCKNKIIAISDSAKTLYRVLATIGIREHKALETKDWKTNRLISRHLDRPDYLDFNDEFSLWTIKQDIEPLINATTSAINDLESQGKGLVEHPMHYFSRQANSCYESFFKKPPAIYRDSKFVEAIDKMARKANILNNKTNTSTYNFLNLAKKRKGVNDLGFLS